MLSVVLLLYGSLDRALSSLLLSSCWQSSLFLSLPMYPTWISLEFGDMGGYQRWFGVQTVVDERCSSSLRNTDFRYVPLLLTVTLLLMVLSVVFFSVFKLSPSVCSLPCLPPQEVLHQCYHTRSYVKCSGLVWLIITYHGTYSHIPQRPPCMGSTSIVYLGVLCPTAVFCFISPSITCPFL